MNRAIKYRVYPTTEQCIMFGLNISCLLIKGAIFKDRRGHHGLYMGTDICRACV